MTLLALECSSARRSVAIARDTELLAVAAQSVGHSTHSTTLFGLVDDALGIAGIGRDALDALAIGVGPGSYTGIRAAIAVAQGWELATSLRLMAVPSTLACAFRARELGLRGWTLVAVDAQRGEFYVHEIDLSADALKEVAPLRLVTRDELERLARNGAWLVGPDVGSFGSGTRVVMPDAAAIAALAFERPEFVPGHRLEPIYLRPVAFTKAPRPRVLTPLPE